MLFQNHSVFSLFAHHCKLNTPDLHLHLKRYHKKNSVNKSLFHSHQTFNYYVPHIYII